MLYNFLLKNQEEILAMTQKKSLELAGVRPSSQQLKAGLPIFYRQLLKVLRVEKETPFNSKIDLDGMKIAAHNSDESAMATAAGRPADAELAESAGQHGSELLRLGYTLSHVVHAYGDMCQSITELATEKNQAIGASEFRDLNRCLDAAIAGAVTEYQSLREKEENCRNIEHLGFLAHELRNSLASVYVSLSFIKTGTVGFGGSVGAVLDSSLKRIEKLIDQSLTEVRLRVDSKIHAERVQLVKMIDQIVVTAEIEAQSRKQTIEIQVDPVLVFDADQQLVYTALSNLIQNALKYSHDGGKIQVRGSIVGDRVVVEVEDECGGLSDASADIFKPYVQLNENRKGLGLGLTIAKRAISLSHGTIDVTNLPGRGCIFKITLPKTL